MYPCIFTSFRELSWYFWVFDFAVAKISKEVEQSATVRVFIKVYIEDGYISSNHHVEGVLFPFKLRFREFYLGTVLWLKRVYRGLWIPVRLVSHRVGPRSIESAVRVYHCDLSWCIVYRRLRGQSLRQAALRWFAQQLQPSHTTGRQQHREAHRLAQTQTLTAHRRGKKYLCYVI